MNPQPWYTSPVFVSAICNVIIKFGLLIGIVIVPAKLNDAITATVILVSLCLSAYVARKRAKSDVAPLTISRKSADSKTTSASQLATNIVNATQNINSPIENPTEKKS